MIRRVLVTEKALRLAEKENKVTFIVDRSATKRQIADAVKSLYGVEVEYVNTLITPTGEKKAIVKLAEGHNAMDLLGKLGVL